MFWGATMSQSQRLWSQQSHLAWHLTIKKKDVQRHKCGSVMFTLWRLCSIFAWLVVVSLALQYIKTDWTATIFGERVRHWPMNKPATLGRTIVRTKMIDTSLLHAYIRKRLNWTFQCQPNRHPSINSSLCCTASLRIRSMELVFSGWGWGDSGPGSNERGGIPQHRVNNFSNFRYAENPKQWDNIDNWSMILWN